MNAYFLSHNGLGDNITSIGAVNFLLKYYNTVYFLCKNIHEKNVKNFFIDKNVVVVPFNSKNEFRECKKIINSVYNDNNNDIFICGYHKSYLKSKITNEYLLQYKKDDKHYSINYSFIKEFYDDIGLDLSIYYEYFDIPSNVDSLNLYNEIKNYNIIFMHTQSSNKTISLDDIINKFIENDEYIIICANKNVYDKDSNKYMIVNKYVNIPVSNYIDIIKNSYEIHVIDSCFSCIVLPLSLTKKMKCNYFKIYDRI